MKKIYFSVTITILLFPNSAVAVNQKAVDACGMYKDIVLKVANNAEKGVPKDKVKNSLPPNFGEMVDFVYYFNGVKTKNEIVSNQLNECLSAFAR